MTFKHQMGQVYLNGAIVSEDCAKGLLRIFSKEMRQALRTHDAEELSHISGLAGALIRARVAARQYQAGAR
jgi:hypothetical protein